MEKLTAGSLGERELIHHLRREFPDLWLTGDDAAVLEALTVPVVSTDSFFEGIHFYFWWASAQVLGRRMLEATLSDLAAMGAEPRCVLVSLTLPGRTDLSWLEDLYRGLMGRKEVLIAGGDIVGGSQLGVSLTALGEGDDRSRLMLRSNLLPGQSIWSTGMIGRALDAPRLIEEAGELTGPDLMPSVDALNPSELEQLRAFLRPRAQFEEARLLRGSGVRCAIDVSDGVLSEGAHLAQESGVDAWIDLDSLPLFDSVADRPLAAAAAGEDFVLLFSAHEKLDFSRHGFTQIGEAGEGPGRLHVMSGGTEIEPLKRGYDHLS